MHTIKVETNLAAGDLVQTIALFAFAENIEDPLRKALGAADHVREPVREYYLRQIMDGFTHTGKQVDRLMVTNAGRLLSGMLAEPEPDLSKGRISASLTSWMRGRKPGRLLLSQANIDELAALIRQHYRIAIRAGSAPDWNIDANMERRWKNLGILRPSVFLGSLIGDAFTAGRLAQVLEDGNSLQDMRRMAMEFPISRAASLTMQAVTDRVGYDLVNGLGGTAETTATRLILDQNAKRVQDIALLYRRGALTHTPTNRKGLSPEEMEKLGTDQVVEGWRGLGRELRNRMAAVDRERDWDRVAASATRMTANIGAIGAMAEAGAESLYYDVHKDACDYCKKVYLLDDGTPRIFPIGVILENIAITGGANYGRLASKIGDPDRGWLATGVLHPWCQCRPVRLLAGVAPHARA